jgi:hypothetical protein
MTEAIFSVYELWKAKKIRLSRGAAVLALDEICIDDISATLRANRLEISATFYHLCWTDAPHYSGF